MPFVNWPGIDRAVFNSWEWQEANAVQDVRQLAQLSPLIDDELEQDMLLGIKNSGMSIRLTPYVVSLINWSSARSDPIRRQFLPLGSEQLEDHPALRLDPLQEQADSAVPGLVHRYPTKVLLLATSVCPVYCQYCTRSYAVGLETQTTQKVRWPVSSGIRSAITYIANNPQINDVVISGGDAARLKHTTILEIGRALIQIPHVRIIRFATKSLAVCPMAFLTGSRWYDAIRTICDEARVNFKQAYIHTHFNHPNEITEQTTFAMQRMHRDGIYVRNQSVLLKGVNDNIATMRCLATTLTRNNIHPYYIYMCDMVPGTEHFRVPMHKAIALEKQMRGTISGFDTPLFVVDTPGGKRDIHSYETYDRGLGISVFVAPSVKPGEEFKYYDPIEALHPKDQLRWSQNPLSPETCDVIDAS